MLPVLFEDVNSRRLLLLVAEAKERPFLIDPVYLKGASHFWGEKNPKCWGERFSKGCGSIMRFFFVRSVHKFSLLFYEVVYLKYYNMVYKKTNLHGALG